MGKKNVQDVPFKTQLVLRHELNRKAGIWCVHKHLAMRVLSSKDNVPTGHLTTQFRGTESVCYRARPASDRLTGETLRFNMTERPPHTVLQELFGDRLLGAATGLRDLQTSPHQTYFCGNVPKKKLSNLRNLEEPKHNIKQKHWPHNTFQSRINH